MFKFRHVKKIVSLFSGLFVNGFLIEYFCENVVAFSLLELILCTEIKRDWFLFLVTFLLVPDVELDIGVDFGAL